MERIILEIRCGTLSAFIDRIDGAPNERERIRIAVDASKIADKIIEITPQWAFTPSEWDLIERSLEHYSLAVFCDISFWARQSLDDIKESTRPLF